jgi:O-antigen ligase
MISAVNLSTTSLRAAMAQRARKYGSPASLPIASEVTVNPHNQTFAIAVQLGVIGTLALWAMWIAHFLLFRSGGFNAWLGTVIVVDNVVCSTVHSHLFDFNNG